jgi:GAF domain-containing protein
MKDPDDTLRILAAIAARDDDRTARASDAAECIRRAGDFHWVGLYDVRSTEICAIAWTGPNPPAFPAFPKTQGLNGAAVADGYPLVVNDVRSDPRYLTTFGTTRAEAIIPVRLGDRIAGTIDVESDRVNAFSSDHAQFLRRCAAALAPLWSQDAL